MGCIGNRRKAIESKPEQKWDYINLQDFRSKGCGTPTAYVSLWFSLILSVALYAVDSFTAVNLLVFDRWSSDIKPAIGINISKYIFAGCIILSFVNLLYEWVRAARVMKRGNIAECYLDNLAVRWESIRMGSGQGWRRFLVFAELTKNKKGAEYVALFTYLNLQSWIRVLVCTGPRQVVNAYTLKAVYESDLLTAENDVSSSFSTFFSKLQVLAEKDYRQAVILSGMVFTLLIWVFSVLFLLASILAYVLFLFHWIPRDDGGLTGYCERKINKALLKIVTDKVNKALARQDRDRFNAEARAAKKKTGGDPKPFMLERAPTLPTIPAVALANGDKLPEMPSLARAPTVATLPEYSPRPASPGGYEKRAGPTRSNTSTTYSSRVSLLSSAADMGFSGGAPPMPRPAADPYRPPTSNSMRSMAARNVAQQRQHQHQPPMPPIGDGGGGGMYAREYTETPMQIGEDGPFGPPVRSPTAFSVANSVQSFGRAPTAGPGNGFARPPTAASMASGYGRPPTAGSAVGGYSRPPPHEYGRAPPATISEDGYGQGGYGYAPTNGYAPTVNDDDYSRSEYGRPPTTVHEDSYGRPPVDNGYGYPPMDNGYGRRPSMDSSYSNRPPMNNNYARSNVGSINSRTHPRRSSNDTDAFAPSSPPTYRSASPTQSIFSTTSSASNRAPRGGAGQPPPPPRIPLPVNVNRPRIPQQPARSATNPMPPRGPALYSPQPRRNMTGIVSNAIPTDADVDAALSYDTSPAAAPPQRGDPAASFDFDLEGGRGRF